MVKHRSKVGALGVAASYAVASVGVATPAVADNLESSPPQTIGGYTAEVSLANNKWQGWSFHSTPGVWQDAFDQAIFWSYGESGLVVTQKANNTTHVDVRISIGAIGLAGAQGFTYCPSDGIRSGTDPTESCFKQWLKINTNETGSMNADQRKSLACHEFGHTFGLRHSNEQNNNAWHPARDEDDSCIFAFGGPDRAVGLHTHDKDELDATY